MITFRKLDGNREVLNDQSSLGSWYLKVRDIPLDELTVGDICRSCRQELFLEMIVPVALSILDRDFNSGELFNGELVSVLVRIPADYWKQHIAQANCLMNVCQEFIIYFDDDVKLEIDIFMRKMNTQASQ